MIYCGWIKTNYKTLITILLALYSLLFEYARTEATKCFNVLLSPTATERATSWPKQTPARCSNTSCKLACLDPSNCQ